VRALSSGAIHQADPGVFLAESVRARAPAEAL
jgi:hypothetical protein